MNESIIKLTEQWVQEQLSHDTTGHDWYHIKRVTTLAKHLSIDAEVNMTVIILACLMHDLADDKVVESEEAGLASITNWLEDHDVSPEDTKHILSIITTMSFKAGKGDPMRTLEGQIVQDADRLDALGAIGIARTFTYSGHKKQSMYDPTLRVRENMSIEEYRHGQSSAIQHFYEKLLKLPERMNTTQGRVLADQRAEYMRTFLEQFYSEWSFE